MNADEACRHVQEALIVVACSLGIPANAQAQNVPGYPHSVEAFDPREVAMLPRYCIHTQLFNRSVPGGSNPAAISGWYDQLGPTFAHMHHYCFGLMKVNRAVLLSRDEMTRRYYLADAVTELDYVIGRAPQDFILLPEIFTKKGQILVLQGKGPVGEFEFERAIEMKRDYWPAYGSLSDYYKQAGNIKKAREVLESGLQHAPEAKGLQRRLAELNPASDQGPGNR